MATTYKLIDKSTVGAGGASSVTFSNIPQTYTDLKLVASIRSSNTDDNIEIRPNGATTGYTQRSILANGSSATSTNRSDIYFLNTITLSSYTASTFANLEIYLPNYTSSNNKSFSIDAVTENNATSALSALTAGLLSTSSPITSFVMAKSGGTFTEFSTFYLYGIKNS